MTAKPSHTPEPCPFCGSTHLDYGMFQNNDWHVNCRTCGFHNGHHKSEEAAWLHWNTRALSSTLASVRAALEGLLNADLNSMGYHVAREEARAALASLPKP